MKIDQKKILKIMTALVLITILIIVIIIYNKPVNYTDNEQTITSGENKNNEWEQIKTAILNCEVDEVMQAHSQYVSANLKNGRKLEGFEPNIDDIIDLALEAQDKCGEIIMATE